MKFTDLSPAKQQLLKAFTEGETIQVYTLADGWTEEYANGFLYLIDIANLSYIRVKPKEPVVKLECFAIYDCGYVSNIRYDSIQYSSDEVPNYHLVVSWLVKTYIDDVFIKAEIVQE